MPVTNPWAGIIGAATEYLKSKNAQQTQQDALNQQTEAENFRRAAMMKQLQDAAQMDAFNRTQSEASMGLQREAGARAQTLFGERDARTPMEKMTHDATFGRAQIPLNVAAMNDVFRPQVQEAWGNLATQEHIPTVQLGPPAPGQVAMPSIPLPDLQRAVLQNPRSARITAQPLGQGTNLLMPTGQPMSAAEMTQEQNTLRQQETGIARGDVDLEAAQLSLDTTKQLRPNALLAEDAVNISKLMAAIREQRLSPEIEAQLRSELRAAVTKNNYAINRPEYPWPDLQPGVLANMGAELRFKREDSAADRAVQWGLGQLGAATQRRQQDIGAETARYGIDTKAQTAEEKLAALGATGSPAQLSNMKAVLQAFKSWNIVADNGGTPAPLSRLVASIQPYLDRGMSPEQWRGVMDFINQTITRASSMVDAQGKTLNDDGYQPWTQESMDASHPLQAGGAPFRSGDGAAAGLSSAVGMTVYAKGKIPMSWDGRTEYGYAGMPVKVVEERADGSLVVEVPGNKSMSRAVIRGEDAKPGDNTGDAPPDPFKAIISGVIQAIGPAKFKLLSPETQRTVLYAAVQNLDSGPTAQNQPGGIGAALTRPARAGSAAMDGSRNYGIQSSSPSLRAIRNLISGNNITKQNRESGRCAGALGDAFGFHLGDAQNWPAGLEKKGWQPVSDAQPGDVVWFPTSKPQGHIGIIGESEPGHLRYFSNFSGKRQWRDVPTGTAQYYRPPGQ